MMHPESGQRPEDHVVVEFPADSLSSSYVFYKAAIGLGFLLKMDDFTSSEGREITRVQALTEDDVNLVKNLENSFRQSPVGVMSACVGDGYYMPLMLEHSELIYGRVGKYLSYLPMDLRNRAFIKAFERDLQSKEGDSLNLPNADPIFRRARSRYHKLMSQGAEGITESEMEILAVEALSNVVNLLRISPFK